LSEDPIGFKSGDTNFYRYVLNDPISNTDPSGLASRNSIYAFFLTLGLGTAYDWGSTISEAAKLIDEADAKIAKLDEEIKSCKSETKKDELKKKKQEIVDGVQSKSLINVMTTYTPGLGAALGVAGCIASLVFL